MERFEMAESKLTSQIKNTDKPELTQYEPVRVQY